MSVSNKPGSITKAVIPAAGKGTRLLPLTKAVPKELIPLGDRPVLEYIVEETIAAGITEILFIISPEKTAIRSHFGDGANGVRFEYAFQPEQKGLAHAISYGREFTGDEPFAVVLGDSTIDTDQAVSPFKRVLDKYSDTGASGVIVVQKTPLDEVSRYGIVKPCSYPVSDGSFEIDGLVEKPSPSEAPSEYAIAGRYAFSPAIYECIARTLPGAKGELQITDSIGLLLEEGRKVWCVALGDDEIRRDIGTFPSYFEAFRIHMDRYTGS